MKAIKYSKQRFIHLDLMVLNVWKGQIDPTDCFIFYYVKQMEESKSAKVESKALYDGTKRFVWINYPTLLKAMPLVKLKKDALSDRIAKICRVGLFERINKRTAEHRVRTYLRIAPCYSEYGEMMDEAASEVSVVRRSGVR